MAGKTSGVGGSKVTRSEAQRRSRLTASSKAKRSKGRPNVPAPGQAWAGAKVTKLTGRVVEKLVGYGAPGRGRRPPVLAAVVAVQDSGQAQTDRFGVAANVTSPAAGRKGGVLAKVKAAAALARRIRVEEVAGLLAAAGSAHRLRVLAKLLEGPANYQTLVRATKLKSGPLYHHIAELRAAGLVRPRQHDLYSLTRGGRNLILVVLTLPSLTKDQRPTPG
ncbi:MAG: winged helix-turn-helix domain-containing protein [Phycisphaerae bacterium]